MAIGPYIRTATRSLRHPNSKIPEFRDGVHGANKKAVLALFTAANYCFSTWQAGRTPTMYFAQGGNLQQGQPSGRLRTTHRKGPLIDVKNAVKHHYFTQTTAQRDTAYDQLAGNPTTGLPPAIPDTVGVPLANYSHVEMTLRPGGGWHRRHRSGGQVQVGHTPTDAQIKQIIERMYRSGARIRIDGNNVLRVNPAGRGSGPVDAWFVPMNVGQYLASLP